MDPDILLTVAITLAVQGLATSGYLTVRRVSKRLAIRRELAEVWKAHNRSGRTL